MGDVASSLVSASTEELLRQAAAQEVKTLTDEYRLALAQALFLSVIEEKESNKVSCSSRAKEVKNLKAKRSFASKLKKSLQNFNFKYRI
jgi:type IV pilus biogenesis protein CpaD/CtpE